MPSDILMDKFGREMREGTYFVVTWNNELTLSLGIRKLTILLHDKCINEHHKNIRIVANSYVGKIVINSNGFIRASCVVIPDNICELDEMSIIGYIKLLGIEVPEKQ